MIDNISDEITIIVESYQAAKEFSQKSNNEVVHLYHILEDVKMNAVQLSKLTIDLRKALQTRRIAKETLSHWQHRIDAVLPILKQLRIQLTKGEEQKLKSMKRIVDYKEQAIKEAKERGYISE